MPKGEEAGTDGLGEQIQAAREFAPGIEVQQLKASVRARLFGTFEGAPIVGGYTLRRMIGRGGMGAVFEAVGRDGEAIALKVLRGFDPAALYRFKLEFRALADISHPNLALLHNLVVRGDQAYLTMELVDGVDFLAHVRGEAAGRSERLRAALVQLVAGLEALHAAGKLHRDIKPSNVMVTREGRVVILDFGLVSELAGRGGPEQLVGTPAYMAPEQLLGAAASAASDWYAVGVMIFEALTGRLPFEGADLLRDKCERDAPSPPETEDPRLAELCAKLLSRRPDERPTGAELAALLADREPGQAPVRARALAGAPTLGGLIGREGAFAALRASFAEAARGPVVALVQGRSGMGKSALIRAFAEAALAGALGRDAPALVLAGRCYEREQVPYNAFDSVVDALTGLLLGLAPGEVAGLLPPDVGALARVFPVLRRVVAIAEAYPAASGAGEPDVMRRRQASAALQDMLRRLGERAPLVLVIDDVQWTDGDSAALLAELLLGPGAPRCLVVLGASVDDVAASPDLSAMVHRLRAAPLPVREVALGPLNPAQAAALAESLLRRGAPDADGAALRGRAAVIAAEAGGLPLFVRELAHYVRTSMSDRADLGAARLEALVEARVARLSPAARRMLEGVVIAGRPLELEVAAQAADAGAGRREVQELRASHLVRASKSPRGELVEPYHDRIRAAVAGPIADERARAIHARLAEILLARPGVAPELLADHLRAAGDRVRAAEVTRLAAQRAVEALALCRAADLFRQAAALLPGEDADGRRELFVRAGEALTAAGRGIEAAECLLSAAEGAPEVTALGLRRRAAEVLLRHGAVARGRELVEQVLRELGEPLPSSAAARRLRLLQQSWRLHRRGLRFTPRPEGEIPPQVLLRLDALRTARLAIASIDPSSGTMYMREHLLQCLAAGEPCRVVRAISGYAALVSHDAAGQGRARAAIAEAKALSGRHECREVALYTRFCEGIVEHNAGCFAAARAAMTSLEGHVPRGKGPQGTSGAMLVASWSTWLHSALAHLGDARALAAAREGGVALLRSVGDADGELRLRATLGVLAPLAADDPATAHHDLEVAARWFPSGSFQVERGHAFLAARMTDLYQESGEAGWSRTRRGWPEYVRGFLFQGQFGRIAGGFWRAATALQAARAGARARAELVALVRRTADGLAGEERPWATALAHCLRAGAHSLGGRDDRAAAELTLAAVRADAASLGLFAAAARWHAGRLMGGDRGAERAAAAEAAMRSVGVVAPRKMAAALIPGFPG